MRTRRSGAETGQVGTAIELAVAVLLPTAIGYTLVAARRLHTRLDARRPPLPYTRPIEQLSADVRRLHQLLDETENRSDVPAKNLRCRATRAAYLDALADACRQLDVALPKGEPVPRAEIYRVEAELRQRGLDVRAGTR